MITLESIKDQVAKELGWENCKALTNHNLCLLPEEFADEVARRYAKAVVQGSGEVWYNGKCYTVNMIK